MNKTCTKVVDKAKSYAMQLYVVETICILEVCFPPAFFDIMQHNLIQLVSEMEVCGPMGADNCIHAIENWEL